MTRENAEQVAAIAKGLTEAQRKRLHSVAELQRLGKSRTSALGNRAAWTSRATTRALIDQGLLTEHHLSGYVSATPLGLAVLSEKTHEA